MSDSPFSREHRARFQELLAAGELHALNISDEHRDTGPWHLGCDLGDSDAANRLTARFRAAVQRAAVVGGAPYRVNRLDWWISKLIHGRKLLSITGLVQRSAEYCEELETRSLEVGKAPTTPDIIGGLYRDRYPCAWGEPYMLYDGPRRLFAEPEAEFEYWAEHIWSGFNDDIAKLHRMHPPPKRQENESRQAFWTRVNDRVGFRYTIVKKTIRGLSYDLAVLQANYTIDRGLRGDAATQAFDDASPEMVGNVKNYWRASSKKLGLSYLKQQGKGVDPGEVFREVGADLRALVFEEETHVEQVGPISETPWLIAADPISKTAKHTAILVQDGLPSDAGKSLSEQRRVPSQLTCSIGHAQFRKNGGVWTLSFQGTTILIPNVLGLGYIVELLRSPQVAIEAAQLAGVSFESTKLAALPGIPLADPKAINAVHAELAEKKGELNRLQKADWTRRGVLEEEISKLEEYLRGVKTHRGQARKVAGTAQRSRTSVTNAIRRATERITVQHPALGRHLTESIKTGNSPIYAPANLPDWHF